MRLRILLLCMLVPFAFGGNGCRSTPAARIVRLMHGTNAAFWRMSLGGAGSDMTVPDASLTNRLTSLQLRHGDIILLGSLPGVDQPAMADTWKWLASYSRSRKVAVYLYGVYAPATGEKVFSFPVYHWVAPFDDPLNLAKASFFRDGVLLGQGDNGLQGTFHAIAASRPSNFFLLGSMYDQDRSFSLGASPYEHHLKDLERVCREAGAKPILLNPELGF